jgi:hypothetical protein
LELESLMFPRVVEAKHRGGHVLWLRFADGCTGQVDLADAIQGPIFEPLHSVEYFERFRVDEDLHTVVWPNGADFAPEFLRERLVEL